MSVIVYGWKHAARSAVPAQVAGVELARIQASQGRFFSPSAVVLAARPKKSPLHPAFEWNDAKAAAAHREDQARYLVRNIVVIRQDQPHAEPMRAFVSVCPGDDDHPRYTSVEIAMNDLVLREQVLAQALADMHTFSRKYASFLDLSGVMQAFEQARIRAAGLPDSLTG